MLRALADAVAEKGYVETSVADVLVRAKVSRATFYQQFADKQACFLAAWDHAAGDLAISVAESTAASTSGDTLDRCRALLAGYLGALQREPSFARTFLVEVYAAGPEAIARRRAAQERFAMIAAQVMDPLLRGSDAEKLFAAESLIGAVSAISTSRVASGETDSLPELLEPMLTFVTQYLLPNG